MNTIMLQNICKNPFLLSAKHLPSSNLFNAVKANTKLKATDAEEYEYTQQHWDEFTKEFMENRIEMTTFQKLFLAAGSSIAALVDPRRHDMIACLGETTGEQSLHNILRTMKSSDEGQRILQDKPRINTRTVDIDKLRRLPNNTFGHAYVKFLDVNQVSPDSRMEVRFMNDPELAYIMTRYRECHDLVHTILDMPTNMLGEVAVKWFEALNNGLPMCYGGAIFGAMRLRSKQRKKYLAEYLRWAISNGKNAKPLMNVYWEHRWEQDVDEIRKELQIVTLKDPNRPIHKIWTSSECSKYYLCLEKEVFNFKCSEGLLFDVIRQICDFKQNVDNCDITAETPAPKPLLEEAECEEENHWGCADGTCLPNEYFCDGSVDCPDESDEGWCDAENDPHASVSCDSLECKLPDCFCSKDGTQIPGRLEPQSVPQMVLLNFDDAINFENWELFSQILFKGNRRNPNGCPIRATFFVSHPFTNYQYVQKLWNDGHEIAVHSVTHRGPDLWWSHNATIEDWFDEMVGQANILNRFASVRMEEIRGMRVPFLRVGWNRQFLMMKEFGFVYDASMVAPFTNPPSWPYTLDYKMPHVCTGSQQNCPSRSYPGIWEIVINQLEAGDFTCAMIDSCPPNFSGDDIYRMLSHNFKRHYLSNRAPLGLNFHATWFKKSDYLNAFLKFLDDLQKLPDVYFVTNQQAIQWMRQPQSNSDIHQFSAWGCKPKVMDKHEVACTLSNTCKLRSRVLQQDRYFYTCKECPAQYPWIRNEFGLD